MTRRAAMMNFAYGLTLVALLTACGQPEGAGGDPPDEGSPSPTASATASVTPGAVTEWLAGFRVVKDPAELDADTREFLDLVGGFIFVGPVSCFEGLPAEYASPGDTYVLAVVAGSEEELEQAIELTGREPLFRAQVRSMCID